MCGFCGFVGPEADAGGHAAGPAMLETIRHRGPDGEGSCRIGGELAGCRMDGWLGHRRLKIIDLTEHAHQPMSDSSGAVTLVYNGEVYNFRELRRELAAAGHRFESTGDTEVVLRAYEEWGEDCVTRLDGMFAFAIWDARRCSLFMARDRTGKKPLFYTTLGGRLTFGSEIKCLTRAPWVEASPDLSKVPEFLTFGYVPYPGTMYEGIFQVPPAATVTYGPDGLRPPRAYWDALPEGSPLTDRAEVASATGRLLEHAVERRLIADVPLGALLSGGIDSSIVVGLMTRSSTERVRTFSIGFPEDSSFDERGYARLVADHFGTDHTEFAVKADAVALLDKLLWHHDQPYGDYSAVPTYVVSELARQHVRVVLNGDGGDEVFGGYDRFKAAAVAGLVPPRAARVGARGARLLPANHGYYSLRRRAERFFEGADSPVFERYHDWVAVMNEDLVRDVLAPDRRGALEESPVAASMLECYERAADLPPLDAILYANFKTYLPGDLSVKVDRMTMANSLEARSPFLDTALIELLARVPARQKVGLRRVKPVLRRAFWPLLPKEIWNRRKHGFGVPVGLWFRNELAPLFEDEVLAPGARTADVLDQDAIRRLWAEHRAGEREHGFRFWTLLTLERWLRTADRQETAPPPAGITA